MNKHFHQFLKQVVENPNQSFWTRKNSDSYWVPLNLEDRVFFDSHSQYHVGAVINNIALPACISEEPEKGTVVYLISFLTDEHSLTYNETWKDLFLKGVMYHTLADAKLVSDTLYGMLK